jgi:hypothetical protein
MIAVTATFAVMKRESAEGVLQIVTMLTDLTDIRPHDVREPELPTFSEALRIATDRGLSRTPRVGFLKRFGVVEFVPVCERVIVDSAEEVDALATSMVS